jgi:hypothetical protein
MMTWCAPEGTVSVPLPGLLAVQVWVTGEKLETLILAVAGEEEPKAFEAVYLKLSAPT